jgi:pilus assembly protein CpaE
VNSDSSLFLDDPNADSLSTDLSIALIGPDEDSRRAVADAIHGCQGGEIREYSSYLASLDDLPRLLDRHFDVIIIDLDSRPEYALELVENICAKGSATVMVYSAKADSESLVRCMRAGAREFLTLPLAESTVAEAMIRTSARRPATRPRKKASGRLLAFLGAKGGDGVTTLACNFAVSLAQESGQSTLLIDLDLPLGDAALNLGVSAEYSAINALQNAARLDSSFLSKLLVKHASGVSVLAAPGRFPRFDAPNEAIDKLLTVARQEFENVVVDMGSRLDLMGTAIFKEGSTVYLVIQSHIAGLRNSNRLISQYFSTDVPKLEIVLNRYQSRSVGVAEDQITKALTRPAQWKIPNDYAAVRRMQHTAVPLALEDSPISRLIRQMARSVCGLPPVLEKSSGFSLKKIGRSITSKMSTAEETPAFTQLDLSANRERFSTRSPLVKQPVPPAFAQEKSTDTPAVESEPESVPEAQPLLTAGVDESPSATAESREEASQSEAAPVKLLELETRTYMGATYVRGEDGRWHLQQAQLSEEEKAPSTASDEKETPAIEWSTPDAIVYGTALSARELSASALIPGTFAYSPAEGEILDAGKHTISVIFTPEDSEIYAAVESSVSLIVNQAVPVIAWPTPAQIVYGTPLDSNQLNARSAIPGGYDYQPGAGAILTPGVQVLSVEFAPEDAANYAPAQASVSLTVTLATPAIVWPDPAPIAYGTALSAAQLNANAPVPGTFVYTPSAGEMLPAGEHTISVSFTPKDSTAYRTAGAAVSLVVNKATPIVTWPAPAAISYGAALGAAQLNATALVPGTLIYSPSLGEVLPSGRHSLQVTFMPADTLNYTTVEASVPITVLRETPAVSWATSEPVTFGNSPSATEFKPESEPKPADAAANHARKPAFWPKPEPAEAAPKTPARPPAQVAAKPAVKAPAKAHVRIAEEPTVKVSAKAKAKVVEKPAVKTPARPQVKLAAKHPSEASAQTSAETPANALVKVGGPRAPIEVGPGLDLMGSAVLEDGTTIYLVMQPGSAGLANSSRLVSQFFAGKGPKPGFVINKFEPNSSEAAEESSFAADTRRAVRSLPGFKGQLARPADEASEKPEKKPGFSLKGFGRSIWSKLAAPERVPSMTRLGLAADPNDSGAPAGTAQPETTHRPAERHVHTHPDATLFAPDERAPLEAQETTHRAHAAGAHHPAMHAANASSHHEEPKTRTYRGATYVKGEDGQWHLQQSEVNAVHHAAPAIPLPSSTPIASAAGSNAESRSALAEPLSAAAKKPARKAKPAPKKAELKAPATKRLAKPVAKPAAKASAKRPAKAAVKAAPKAPAKRPVKTAAKPAVMPPAKPAGKTAAKPAAKAPAKQPAKSTAKPLAKDSIRKAAPANKKPVIAARPKRTRKPAPSKPQVDQPSPELEIMVQPQELIVIEPAPELMKES